MLSPKIVLHVLLPAVLGHLAYDSASAQETINSLGMRLVLVPSGVFMMGNAHTADEEIKLFDSPALHLKKNDFLSEYPRHRVSIAKKFYLGVFCVTRGQFRRFVAETGFKTAAEAGNNGVRTHVEGVEEFEGPTHSFVQHKDYNWQKTGFPQSDDHPVVNVTWDDAVAFCKWLSKKEQRTYRLPTEAEWEYACRAGSSTRYSFGDDPQGLVKYGNIADAALRKERPYIKYAASWNDGYAFTSPGGRFLPNAFGLYDMHGNVAQWCADVYRNNYSEPEETYQADPNSDEDDKPERVMRGGGWSDSAWVDRCSFRLGSASFGRNSALGFRVARDE